MHNAARVNQYCLIDWTSDTDEEPGRVEIRGIENLLRGEKVLNYILEQKSGPKTSASHRRVMTSFSIAKERVNGAFDVLKPQRGSWMLRWIYVRSADIEEDGRSLKDAIVLCLFSSYKLSRGRSPALFIIPLSILLSHRKRIPLSRLHSRLLQL